MERYRSHLALRFSACVLVVSILSMTGCAADVADPGSAPPMGEKGSEVMTVAPEDWGKGDGAEGKVAPIIIQVGVLGVFLWLASCLPPVRIFCGNAGAADDTVALELTRGVHELRFETAAECRQAVRELRDQGRGNVRIMGDCPAE